jgi:hypothetical protein
MRVTISRGISFSHLRRVPAIIDADAAVNAVETLIRNSWTVSDIFLIEEAQNSCAGYDNLPPQLSWSSTN